MKFTKFIPIVCALALTVVPALADPQGTNHRDATYQIEVPQVFDITELVAPVTTATGVTVNDALTTLNWTNSLGVTYQVVTNIPNKDFYVKAKVGSVTTKGMLKGSDGFRIAFGNVAVPPTEAAVLDALADSPTPASNVNAFSTLITPSVNAVAGTITGGTDTTAKGELAYTVTKPGTFEMAYTFGTSARTNSFSSDDQAGMYQCTLEITDVATP